MEEDDVSPNPNTSVGALLLKESSKIELSHIMYTEMDVGFINVQDEANEEDLFFQEPELPRVRFAWSFGLISSETERKGLC